jgi:hypothetical protein
MIQAELSVLQVQNNQLKNEIQQAHRKIEELQNKQAKQTANPVNVQQHATHPFTTEMELEEHFPNPQNDIHPTQNSPKTMKTLQKHAEIRQGMEDPRKNADMITRQNPRQIPKHHQTTKGINKSETKWTDILKSNSNPWSDEVINGKESFTQSRTRAVDRKQARQKEARNNPLNPVKETKDPRDRQVVMTETQKQHVLTQVDPKP